MIIFPLWPIEPEVIQMSQLAITLTVCVILKLPHMNKILTILLVVFECLCTEPIFSQVVSESQAIPKQYEGQFKDDEKRYLSLIAPYASSAGAAYNIWTSSVKGNWKEYNTDSVHSIYDSLSTKEFLKNIEFFKQNPDSYASLYYFNLRLANRFRLTPDSLLSVYFLFSESLQNTPLGKSVLDVLKRRQSLLMGNEMPVFSFKTNNGDSYDLSAFRNKKHVLICFWASWCGPCIKSIPLLKRIQNEYKDKDLQVISVSIDDSLTKWLAAEKKYAMPWLQTCDLPAYTNGKELRSLYALHYIPQYFLLDLQGKLIYHNIQSKDDDEYSLLRQVLARELK